MMTASQRVEKGKEQQASLRKNKAYMQLKRYQIVLYNIVAFLIGFWLLSLREMDQKARAAKKVRIFIYSVFASIEARPGLLFSETFFWEASIGTFRGSSSIKLNA